MNNEQTEMELDEAIDNAQHADEHAEGEAKAAELQAVKDSIAKEINAAMETFTSLGLDCMLITSNSELNIEGIFTTSKNRIINLGLSGLATQNV